MTNLTTFTLLVSLASPGSVATDDEPTDLLELMDVFQLELAADPQVSQHWAAQRSNHERTANAGPSSKERHAQGDRAGCCKG